MCLGLNAANSRYFCLWCEGHIRPAIFNMIPLQHWVPDKLHIMLRITDILWRLVFDELRSRNTWKEKARNVIIEEMKRIDVKFYFWLELYALMSYFDLVKVLEEDCVLEKNQVLGEDQDHSDLVIVNMIKQMFVVAVKNI
ncbi:hypothetical protein RhiirA1_450057 [Rhizophagus irregularis]|uniref:Uncharacterized protein n=1 Tax=Rhizophagus irregularis TaxID=588596 RepID=A0A2N0SFT2_9GLOM|nr:hypothetical protein RhiirA1_450057 [Rhizophagus irregularis]